MRDAGRGRSAQLRMLPPPRPARAAERRVSAFPSPLRLDRCRQPTSSRYRESPATRESQVPRTTARCPERTYLSSTFLLVANTTLASQEHVPCPLVDVLEEDGRSRMLWKRMAVDPLPKSLMRFAGCTGERCNSYKQIAGTAGGLLSQWPGRGMARRVLHVVARAAWSAEPASRCFSPQRVRVRPM